MFKDLPLSPQDRRFILDLKESMAIAHRGVDAMPRKAVWMALGKSEGWYSRLLNPEEMDTAPSLLDLRRYAAITGNAEPLRVLAKWWGDGHAIVDQDPHRMLSTTIQADAAFATNLSKALEDGEITREESEGLIPLAEARLRQAQENVDALKGMERRP